MCRVSQSVWRVPVAPHQTPTRHVGLATEYGVKSTCAVRHDEGPVGAEFDVSRGRSLVVGVVEGERLYRAVLDVIDRRSPPPEGFRPDGPPNVQVIDDGQQLRQRINVWRQST